MRFDAGGATHRSAMIGKRTSLWASSVSRQVRVTAEDRELLLIEWLEERVYLLDADQAAGPPALLRPAALAGRPHLPGGDGGGRRLIEELEERVVAAAGLCRKVAQLRPLGVIKG